MREKIRYYIKIFMLLVQRKDDNKYQAGKSLQRYRGILFTGLSASIVKIFTTGISLITVPLTINYLGAERYGLWMTISSVIAFLGFADLGIGNGLVNLIAEANGKDDVESVRRYVSSGFFFLAGIALLILTGFIAMYSLIPWAHIYNVTSDLAVNEAGPATAVLIISFVINMPLGIVQQVQMGYQEGHKNYLWSAVGALLGLAGVLLAIRLQAGLPWLVFAMSSGPIIGLLFNWMQSFGSSHQLLVPNFNSFNWQKSRVLAKIGMAFFALQLFTLIGMYSDNIIIAQMLGAPAVAGYAVVQKIFLMTLMAQYFLTPLWPAFGEALARNELAWARRALNKALVFSLGLGVITSFPLLVLGQHIISVWVSPDVVPSKILLLGFTFWTLVNCIVGPISIYLNSGVLIKRQVVLVGFAALFSLVLKIIGVQYFRIEGVIWATVVGYGVFYIVPAIKLAFTSLKRPNND